MNKYVILTIFLIFGLLGVPSTVFAQELDYTGFDSTLQCSASTLLDSNLPLLKGGGGGGRGGSSRGSRSTGSSSTDDGSYSIWSWIIVLGIIIGLPAVFCLPAIISILRGE